MDVISMVVPCFNEEQSLPYFYEAYLKLVDQMKEVATFELILVDDGSKDKTFKAMLELSEKNETVKYISFSRNFGKEAAMLAGLEKSVGDYCVILDADLQHPPEMICEMYRIIQNEEYDCVAARRVTREGEPWLRSLFSNLFYKIMHKISDVDIVSGACDYRLMSRKMVDVIVELREYNRFSKGIFTFVGFNTYWLPYENRERVAGNTTWSFWGLFKYSLEGILAFSTTPLYFASLLGIIVCFAAVIFTILTVINTILYGEVVSGYPTLICVITFLGGVQLFTVGILGQYIAKMYLETKRRPIYIVSRSNIQDENK